MDAQGEVNRGLKAAAILEDPLFADAFRAIEAEIHEALAEVNMHDKASQTELIRSLKNLRRLRGVLETHIANGRLAAETLRRSGRERIKAALGY